MRFNEKAKSTKTVNAAGGEAYAQTDKLALASMVLTSFVKDQFYRSSGDTIEKARELIKKDPLFAAKCAIYARNEFGMRSISHVIAGELATIVKGKEWTKDFFEKVIRRPDDMLEILSYYYGLGQKNEPNALKKGFAQAIRKFDGFQIAKYRGEGKDVSMIDLVNLVHPVPSTKNKTALKQLMKGKLVSKDTWESELTKAGKDGTDAADVWTKLILEKKIGYFALLRNLRNILETAPELTDKACEMLTDEKLIAKSLVLPFRYTTAIKAIEEASLPYARDTRTVMKAINQAVDISLKNVPELPGDTLVVVDCSGSMMGQPIEIASLFASVLYKANNADLMLFSDDATYINPNPADSTISIAQKIEDKARGGGTNFNAIFQGANKHYDRIIILSDMQGWVGYYAPTKAFNAYKNRTGANPFIYSFDLQGYGDMQFPQDKVFCLAGFSEKVFGLMGMFEKGKDTLVKEIEKVKLND